MDTRSEREPSQNIMISQEQMDDLKAWLLHKDLKDRIKVIVSSVPMFLLDTEDSWGGYKAQLAELLTHITTNDIKHVMVLSGDAHCQNDGLFTIFDNNKQEQGKILEVLVSGLYAVKRNKAGLLSDKMDLKDHGFYVENEDGLKTTLTKNLFARISGNHKDKTVGVWVYDKNNNLLRESHYDLK
jgi:phosphodiesterase/alkaline phosphatase D-like protein